MATLKQGFTAVNGDTVDATYLNNFVATGTVSMAATNKVLGRSTAGAGDVEEIDCTAAGRAIIGAATADAQRVAMGLGDGDSVTFQDVSAASYSSTALVHTYASSTALDMKQAVETITLTGNITFTTANKANGLGKMLFITCDGTARNLTFPATWNWLGMNAPTSIAANKKACLSLFCVGTADSDIYATYTQQL